MEKSEAFTDFVDECLVKDDQIDPAVRKSIFEDPDDSLSMNGLQTTNSSQMNYETNQTNNSPNSPNSIITQDKSFHFSDASRPNEKSAHPINYQLILNQINQISKKINAIEKLQAQTKLQLFIELKNMKQ